MLNLHRQCSECDQAGSSDMEADMAMETLPDGTKRSRRQIKEPVKFVPQDVPPEPKKIPIRNTVIYSIFIIIMTFWGQNLKGEKDKGKNLLRRQRSIYWYCFFVNELTFTFYEMLLYLPESLYSSWVQLTIYSDDH